MSLAKKAKGIADKPRPRIAFATAMYSGAAWAAGVPEKLGDAGQTLAEFASSPSLSDAPAATLAAGAIAGVAWAGHKTIKNLRGKKRQLGAGERSKRQGEIQKNSEGVREAARLMAEGLISRHAGHEQELRRAVSRHEVSDRDSLALLPTDSVGRAVFKQLDDWEAQGRGDLVDALYKELPAMLQPRSAGVTGAAGSTGGVASGGGVSDLSSRVRSLGEETEAQGQLLALTAEAIKDKKSEIHDRLDASQTGRDVGEAFDAAVAEVEDAIEKLTDAADSAKDYAQKLLDS